MGVCGHKRRAGGLVHGALGEVTLVDQVQHVGLDFLGAALGGVATKMLCHAKIGIPVRGPNPRSTMASIMR